MTPRPKEITQWANPMTSNHQRDKLTTKEKDGKPKRFEAQNPWKEKLSLPGTGDRKESSRKGWAEIPRSCQGLRIPETRSTTKVGLKQLKGSTKKALGTKDRYVHLKHSATQWGIKRREVAICEQRGVVFQGTQREELERGSGWKTFNSAENDSDHLGKMIRKGTDKSWKGKEPKDEDSYLRAPWNGNSARDFQGNSTKRKKLWGIRKGPTLWVIGIARVLIPEGSKERK